MKISKIVEGLIVESVNVMNDELSNNIDNPLAVSIISRLVEKLSSRYSKLKFTTKDSLLENTVTIVNNIVVINLLVSSVLIIYRDNKLLAKLLDKNTKAYSNIGYIDLNNPTEENIDIFIDSIIQFL